ncbi:hypothetical protein [Solibaculum mannosilyticum]|uniref:hypothetical protein n=1 Tax=Solibaculum mannosilyticum TaxID=2780922 RepID=UPI0036F2AA6E
MEQKGILHMSTKRKRPQATEKHIWLDCQAPVTLTVFLLALLAFLVSGEGEALFYRDWFSLVKTSFADPAQYVRMFSFVLGSSGFTSFISSWMLFLLVAPQVEEQIGPGKFIVLLAATAGVTGFLGLLSGVTGWMGNGCLVLMLILLTVVFSLQGGRIPVVSGLVLALYIWQQVTFFQATSQIMSQLIPIGGAVIGAVLGLFLHRKR